MFRLSVATLVPIGLLFLIPYTGCTDSSGSNGHHVDGGDDSSADADSPSDADAAGGEDAPNEADAAGSEDAPSDVDASPSVCQGLAQAACAATEPPCLPTSGKHVPTGVSGYAGCATYYKVGEDGSWEVIYIWPAVQVCGIDQQGDCWLFGGGPVPDGWKLVWECNDPACAGFQGGDP